MSDNHSHSNEKVIKPDHGKMAGYRQMGQGHDHHSMMVKDFRMKFWISAIITIPVMFFSPMIQAVFNYRILSPGNKYILLILSSVIYFWGARPFLTGFLDEIRKKSPGMMTLISMAISAAYFYSAATVFGLKGEDFFWELATLIDVMLLGHWIEMKSVLGASKSLQMLASLMPAEVHRINNNMIEDIPLEELQEGNVILIKPGEKVPGDGVITDGSSYLNESMLTGEFMPVKKTNNDSVIGGSINGKGSIKVRVLHTGKDSYLNKVITMVEEAQKSKSRMQNLSDKAARWLTYIALSAGFITLAVWLIAGFKFVFALERMVTVMVISCPHALGLAIPLVAAISTTVSAKKGLLIRNRTAFEESRKITSVIFDKTGTLTTGDFGVTRFESIDESFSKEDILRFAAALEQNSEHPIATGIIHKAKELNLNTSQAADFSSVTGKGVEATVDGKTVKVVSPGYLKDNNIPISDKFPAWESETMVFVIINEKAAGYIALADSVKQESRDAVAVLKKNKITVLMVTGDNEKAAKDVASKLGLDGYYAGVLPHKKAEIVKELQLKKEFVAMTGDGVNDAPALAQADVGIAVGSGTDIAAETADIILVNSNPMDIAHLILFGKATYSKMLQNIIWATGYNIIAIPLAAGVLYKLTGFALNPAIGAGLMSISTIIVVINAQLLSYKIEKIKIIKDK